MPFIAPVIAAVAAAVAWLGPVGMAVLSTVITTGIGFAVKALTPKPKAPEFKPFAPVVADRTQMIRQPIVPRRYPFGEVKLGGILFNVISSEDNTEHRMIVGFCDGPIDGYTCLWFGDQPIWLDQIDGEGEVTAGPFAGYANITLYLGTVDQVANPNLRDTDRGLGIAYADVLIRWDQDVFPSGLPNISAELRGLKFVDSRDSVERFTFNPSVLARGILSDGVWGGNYDSSALPDTFFDAAANVCDEFVSSIYGEHEVASFVQATGVFRLRGGKLQFQTGDRVEAVGADVPAGTPSPAYVIVVRSRSRGAAPDWEVGVEGDSPERCEIKLASSYANAVAGTGATYSDSGSGSVVIRKTGEPRYTCSGVHEPSAGWMSVLTQVVEAMAGRAVEAGGEWRVRAGAYVESDVEIGERDIIAAPKIQTRVSIRDKFNSVIGKYYSPLNDWQPADWPQVKSSTYITEDGEELPRQPLDLPFTTRANMAQRLGMIELRRVRGNQITIDLKCTLKAMQLQAGDVFPLTLPEFGFDAKPFEVQTWDLTAENSGEVAALVVAMTVREVQESIYTWDADEDEDEVVTVARSSLANPWRVPAPTGLYARTATQLTDAADTVNTALLSWSVLPDSTVLQRGHFEVGLRRSTGRAIEFNGVDQWIDFDLPVDLIGDPKPFRVELFVLWDGTEPDSPAADMGAWTNGQAWIYRRGSDGYLVGAIELDGSPGVVEVVSAAALDDNLFTHVALVWDGDTLSLEIDGVVDDTAAASGDLIAVPLASPQYGRGLGAVADTAYWAGALDDLRVWKHTTEGGGVEQALTGRETGLAGYWPSDDRLVGFIADGTSVGNSGTIHGGAVYVSGAIAPGWEPSWEVAGSQLLTGTPVLEAAINYDFRIRAVNSVGVRSGWSYLFGFTVGSVGGAATMSDWGSVAESASTSDDWGGVDEEPADTLDDWGSVI